MKKDKYLQIFNYLLEFSKLRSNPVRDIDNSESQYPDKIWFVDIPEYEIFESIASPNFNQDAEHWLKINKPKREPDPPVFNKLDDPLNDWIIKESLTEDNVMPKLKETIVRNGNTILLSDQPEVEKKFQDYLNNKWLDDFEKYQNEFEIYNSKRIDYEKQINLYKHLFSIYNKAQQFGEEFELIIGIGLLYFHENDNTPRICRHLFTSKAEILFEFSKGASCLKVIPSIDNEIQIELDAILDLFEQFDSNDIIEAEKKVIEFIKEKNITDSPFDIQIKEAIQLFAERLRTDCYSKDELEKPKEIPKKPTVYFAPALLLRKRNMRSFSALYKKIIEDISHGDEDIDIPSLDDIIGILDTPDDCSESSLEETSTFLPDEVIYFPKKYNDEQLEIVEKAKRNNKVLVHGPPGTGKSHTIANLICHLLASGKKVLVTAYTKRALEVLKNQIPDDYKNLIVNLLSGDSTSIQDLESSVNGITNELSGIININNNKREIELRELELASVKEQKANTKNELVKIKEKSSRKETININYQGTLLQIAERLENEKTQFNWFKDNFNNITNSDVTIEINNFHLLQQYYKNIDCNSYNSIVPESGKIISIGELKLFKEYNNYFHQKYPSRDEHVFINSLDFKELNTLLGLLLQLTDQIERNNLPFKQKIISNLWYNPKTWKDKLTLTVGLLSDLQDDKLKHFDRDIEIKYLTTKSLKQLKNDAQTLYEYLNEGNSLSGVLFNLKKGLLPKNIKEKIGFINNVEVNGSPCDTIEEFKTVLTDIKIKQDFEELADIWESRPDGKLKTYIDKAKFYSQLNENTNELILTLEEAYAVRTKIEGISSIKIQDFYSEGIRKLIIDADDSMKVKHLKILEEIIDTTNKYLSANNIHPIANDIKNAIAIIDSERYAQLQLELTNLESEKNKYNEYKKLQEKLQKDFPILINEILANNFEESNLQNLLNAIYYKHASSEIEKILHENYESNLSITLTELEDRETKLISEIGAKKAWLYVLEGLSRNFLLQQHLHAWVQAVRKIGKTGKGKRALKFRKEAQSQMEKCKSSVPCWIMPLYKVAETVNPEKGMYDYAIVDEASQLGADAIFLLYISKKIIIVGDDKQVSPEYVGVDANAMTPFIKKHLHDIPFANYYGTEFSFFDHAKRFCKGMTVLREHFRCMPEIIEFCNKYFYAPEGNKLYPLKQYSENRLNPLRTIYCQNGYVEGTYQNITNKVEAEAIANKMFELINNDNYRGKTFGVINLQGNKQGQLIENHVIKRIGEIEYKKRKIVCGTSANFQGDERDIMFLSLVTANNHNRSALVKPEDERRFNVAVSRAKEQLWLVHSIQLDDLSNNNDLRYKLLDHFVNYKPKSIPPQQNIKRTIGTQPEPFESWFEVDVYNDILNHNFDKVIPQYEVAQGKFRIDLVVILSNGIKIAVECDGDKYHGSEQFQNDMMRQKVLERCGWQFVRVRGAEYYSNRISALEPLWELLKANDIQKEEFQISKDNEEVDINGINNNYNEEENSFIDNQMSSNNQKLNEQIGVSKESYFVDKSPESQLQAHIENKIKSSPDLFSNPEILVFTTSYNVYKIQNTDYNEFSQLFEDIEFESDERPYYLTGTYDYSGYLVVAFENGKVGKIPMRSFRTEYNRKKLKNAYSQDSKLIFIEQIEVDIDLVAISSINKVILFNTNKINPVESRISKGVQVMRQKDGSKMVKIRKLNQVKFNDPEYYRKEEGLNKIGYYLKHGDEIL
jgi:very-short-patch-repair endonuclease